MEISKKKSGSGEIPKRNRSLDIKSLYEPRFSELEEGKKKVSDKNEQEGSKKKKRKSGKEVSLSCPPEPDAKKRRKEKSNGVKPDVGSGQKSNHGSKELHGSLLSLGDHGSSFKIPKRPRGFVGRKKSKSDQASISPKVPKPVDHVGVLKGKVIKEEAMSGSSEPLVRLSSPSTGNHGVSVSKSVAEVSDLNLKLKKKVDSKQTPSSNSSNKKSKPKLGAGVGPSNKRGVSKSKPVVEVNDSNSKSKQKANSKPTLSSKNSDVNLKPKVGGDEVEEKKTGQASSAVRVVKEYNQVVEDGDVLPNKQRSNSRKKNLVVGKDGGEPSRKKSKPFLVTSDTDSCFIGSLNDDDDDEENLEENAARMLSSRFDPSCTGFTSRRKSSATEADVHDSLSRQGKSLGTGEPAPADVKTRARRPIREDKGMGVPRKRRHFYDILATDLDPYWFLKRRIKIYWPLDECWYDGFVDDYLSETKLHHVKYDDREEEWVNLKVEKFKLLLLRNEVPDKANSEKCSKRKRDSCKVQIVQAADDASCDEDDLDSEPIASWLASQSQRVKALPKPKRRRTSEKILSLVSSLSTEKMDNSNINVANSNNIEDKPDCESASADNLLGCGTVDKSALEASSSSQNGKQMVYARRKSYRRKSERGSLLCKNVNAFGSGPPGDSFPAPPTVGLSTTKDSEFSYGCTDSCEQLWILDDKDKLRLNDVFLKSKEFSIQIYLSVSPFMEFSREIGPFWLLHNIFMLKHGAVVITSPAVILEMLLIDRNHGLRFLFFEGCLKHALAFVFLILTVFSQSDEHWNGDMNFPVTCIRFQLSSVQDVRKRHVFAFYSFSGLQRSKWQNLDSKILRQCTLIQQLSVSECRYGNGIKELECGSSHQCKPRVGLELALNEGFKNKFLHAIWPLGVFSEPCNTGMSQSAFSLAAKPGEVPQFALSFPAAPTFFLTLHLQLLMERSFSWVNIRHQSEQCSIDDSENADQPVVDCTQCGLSAIDVQDVTSEHEIRKMDKEYIAVEGLPCYNQDLGMDVVLASDAAENTSSSEKFQKQNLEDVTVRCVTETATEVITQSHPFESEKEVNDQIVVSTLKTVPIMSPTSNLRSDSTSGSMTVGIPDLEQVDMPFAGNGCISKQTSDLDWNVHDDVVHSPNHTVSTSSRKFGRNSSISSPLGQQSPVWSDRKPTFMQKGLSNGPKRRRTHVQYTLPYAGHDLNVKEKVPSLRSLPCKRIRRASLKRLSDGSGNNHKNMESLTCVANVLVTHGDKGWRECGALIVLEVADHNEWRLTVKVSGAAKYFYKVKHILQPGSTNRFTHAMMWKGGKDWVLEFPNRSQWTLFKEMHEECYNRNIRAASVKNIPIPGVRLVEESDDYGDEFPFIRNPIRYFRQVQTDVEMAMDPSRILYDMDSDDEHWLMKKGNCNGEHKYEEITEELLEKAMDTFEKFSYAQRRGEFTDAELEKLVTGIGSLEAAKVIYEHWRQKREKTGMPLIRHLQPPLWQRYQLQVKEWEHNVSRDNYSFSVSSQKVPAPEKPQMFAFCLRPRGLDVPNKGSKQRSHRKLSVSGHHLAFGRRSNGHAIGDEKMLYPTSLHDSSYVSPSLQASRRALSPRDAHFSLSNAVSELKGKPKGYKNKPKKLGSHLGFGNQQIMSYDQRTGIREEIEPLDISDLDELRWREASGAAQHAVSLAKLKREKAQRLFRRADSAMHDAVVALMTAEAMKDSTESSNVVS